MHKDEFPFKVSTNWKLLVLLCTNSKSGYAIRVKTDSKYNDSLWLCVRSSIVPACWQSTASFKAWRGRKSGFRIRMKEEGGESGRAAGQKNGDMKQDECWEITKRRQWRSRPARTGSKNHRGEAEIKEELGTGRTALPFFFFLFQLSHCLRLQGQATADPPCAHFTAQASINYQTRTLDIDRQLGCRTASANTVASEDTVGAVTGAVAEPCSSVWLSEPKWFTQNQRC